MDVSNLLESEWLGVQFVKDSQSKTGVILTPGVEALSKDQQYKNLEVLIEIDGKKKKWKVNKNSLKNLASAWGKDSALYVGHIVKFSIVPLQGGKEGIVGTPHS
jgi:hypothetical protein